MFVSDLKNQNLEMCLGIFSTCPQILEKNKNLKNTGFRPSVAPGDLSWVTLGQDTYCKMLTSGDGGMEGIPPSLHTAMATLVLNGVNPSELVPVLAHCSIMVLVGSTSRVLSSWTLGDGKSGLFAARSPGSGSNFRILDSKSGVESS